MNVNSITSKIVANIDFVAKLYKIIKEAGGEAIKEKRISDEEIVVKINSKSRFSEPRKTKDYKVEFNQNDITIVGGEALNIYDYKLSSFKSNKGLNTLEKYIKKSTSDIDIVWWPRVTTKNNGLITEIVTSRSEAIVHLTTNFRKILQAKLNENKTLIVENINPYINGYTNSDIINIDVAYNPYYALGTISLPINITVKGNILKLCDISIHDTGASQTYDMSGNKLDTLKYMTEDPVYSTPVPGTIKSILYLDVNGIDIAVPSILSFFNQQLFAFNNFVRAKNPKCLINYKRIEFLRLILNKAENNSTYNKLIEVFNTNNSELLSNLERQMDDKVFESIEKYDKELREICGNFKNNSNSLVKELCHKKIPKIEEPKVRNMTGQEKFIIYQSEQAQKVRNEASKRLAASQIEYAKFLESQKALELEEKQKALERQKALELEEKQKREKEIQQKLQKFKEKFNKKQKVPSYSYQPPLQQGYSQQRGYPVQQGYPQQRGYLGQQIYPSQQLGSYPQPQYYVGKGRKNKTIKKYKLKENN
jgi:hypothetical protein